MKKGDYLILAVAFCIVLEVVVWYALSPRGGIAEIYSDGILVETVNLNEDTEFTIYSDDSNYNVFKVADGCIGIIESNCPHKDCINQGFISCNNETIVCLPHKITVRIKQSDNNFDAVSY